MINVVISGSSFLTREGFKKILEGNSNYEIIGELSSKTDFWLNLSKMRPDILVFDCNAQNLIEDEDLNMVKEFSPHTKILIISDYHKQEKALKLISIGVLGYLAKECGKNEIMDALESIVKGERFFCKKILDVILDKKLNGTKDNSELTEREIEIIRLISEKYSYQEIADMLFISVHTVYTHRRNIMKKLKLKSPVELILYAIDAGIIRSYLN